MKDTAAGGIRATQGTFSSYQSLTSAYLWRQKSSFLFLHTCDTFLNQNREIWNFWTGNLCLVSGGFHVANFRPFLPKLKSRNLVTFLEICYRASQCQHMPTEVRICVRLQFKKPPLILF